MKYTLTVSDFNEIAVRCEHCGLWEFYTEPVDLDDVNRKSFEHDKECMAANNAYKEDK